MGAFKKYDIETFLADLKTIVSANLNSYITTMNQDKADFQIAAIKDGAYAVQTLNDAFVNYDDFVFIFEESVAADASGPEIAETYTVVCAIVSNYGNDATGVAYKKQFRYREILKQIIKDKWHTLSRPAHIIVSSLSPFGVVLANRSNPQMGVGISLEVSFA